MARGPDLRQNKMTREWAPSCSAVSKLTAAGTGKRSVTYFLQIFAIKSRSRQKTEQMQKLLAPHFFSEGRPNFSIAHSQHDLPSIPSTVWQSLVAFRLLISICKGWQWSGMQNLHIVGKISPPVWSHLWTKVHVILRRCRRHLVVCNALARLCISCFILKI